MDKPIRRIGILTGGGDCPGLNAVIRAVTLDALHEGLEVVGFLDGYLGLIENKTRSLGPADVVDIISEGGTILGTSNKGSPFRYPIGEDVQGKVRYGDVCDRCIETVRATGINGLIVIGGDGTMTIASQLADRCAPLDLPVIGIPKTIDNDLYGTTLTFGFLTAVSIATEALDRLRTTAASHHRVMVLEVMGRNAGWIALYSGVAGGADVILIPEAPFSFDALAEDIRRRMKNGNTHVLVVVAEGATATGGEQVVARRDESSPDPVRLGGIGRHVADTVEKMTGVESRYVVLGHVQRGGSPVAADRILGTQFGHHAVRLLMSGAKGRMVALKSMGSADGSTLSDVPLSEPAGRQRLVGFGAGEHPLVTAARAVNTSFGSR